METLGTLADAKLLPLEQDCIREAADTLLFSDSMYDPDALAALERIEWLARHLAESGRWSDERARQLADDVIACGPVEHVA